MCMVSQKPSVMDPVTHRVSVRHGAQEALSACAVCAYEAEHYEWPLHHPDTGKQWGEATHCNDCHRTWSSRTESHCMICHQHFNSDSVGDLHEPYCTPDPTATAQNMDEARTKAGNPLFDTRQRKDGTVWIRWRSEPHYQVATP